MARSGGTRRRGRSPVAGHNIVRVGSLGLTPRDLYARLLRTRWRNLLAGLAVGYLAVNAIFAGLYLAAGDAIDGARPAHFADAFAFSVQTLSTIGYGHLTPRGPWGNGLATAEAFVGLLSFALIAGVVFAKFARPSAGILFSDKLVVTPRDGVPCLMLRIANARGSEVVEARVRMTALMDERTKEGHELRRLHDLKLVRDTTPLLIMSWLVIHPIDEASPLHGLSPEDLARGDVRIIVNLTGLDGLFQQTVYAYYQYFTEDVHFGKDFVDMISPMPDGRLQLDLSRFHELREAPMAGAGGEGEDTPGS